ncbi:hypothetical protein QJS66_04250 [Kocuria rhizophila]|nr:hypothetical protein QJS66_04250 [Kocuria rhizophila]
MTSPRTRPVLLSEQLSMARRPSPSPSSLGAGLRDPGQSSAADGHHRRSDGLALVCLDLLSQVPLVLAS